MLSDKLLMLHKLEEVILDEQKVCPQLCIKILSNWHWHPLPASESSSSTAPNKARTGQVGRFAVATPYGQSGIVLASSFFCSRSESHPAHTPLPTGRFADANRCAAIL